MSTLAGTGQAGFKDGASSTAQVVDWFIKYVYVCIYNHMHHRI